MPGFNKKTFEDYLSEKLPNWEAILDPEAFADLKRMYDEAQKEFGSANRSLSYALNHNQAGIDYSTDFENYNKKGAAKMRELNDAIDFYRSRYVVQDDHDRTLS